ncbi:MAG: head-tail connector protein [Rhizobium sp.]|nr:head-tail connector protein [Rhizobium sp.]MBW8321993.1 head-tail connector protein [Rhizobium sp.]MBW8447913.1 head-tail connector protein [Arenimonas sp.]
MAAKAEPKAPTFPAASVGEEALSRLKDARAQKNEAEKDLQEAYFFTRPRLCWDVKSTQKKPQRRDEEREDLATGIGSEVSEDFATEAVAAFFPQGTDWVESTIDESEVVDVPAEEVQDLKATAIERNKIIFSAIRSSNFESELGTSLDPHLAVGTVAWWIDKPFNTRPINTQHVPPRELEFNVEADGSIGDRFRVRWVKGSKMKSVLPDVTLPEKVAKKIRDEKNCTIEVVWCFWRDWSDPENDKWTHVLVVDKIAVHEQTLDGEGCLPLVIARISPDSEYAWGFGPSIKSLQEYRVLDVITAATQDRVDIAVSPPMGYPDDGVMDFEGGIEGGKAYPMRPGSGRDIVPLYFEGNPDLGYYTATDLERRIRRKHFADYPEQKGDTPPTATQWVDEMVKAQRRIGTPGKKFWREGPYAIYRRFEWLLEKDGKIADIMVNGRKLTLVPNNPATQAADNQKVQIGMQVLGLAKSYFPETSAAAIDERATIDNLKRLTKDEVVVLRDEAQTQALLQKVIGMASEAGIVPGGQQK